MSAAGVRRGDVPSDLLGAHLIIGGIGRVNVEIPRSSLALPIGQESFSQGVEEVQRDLRVIGESVISVSGDFGVPGETVRRGAAVSGVLSSLSTGADQNSQLVVNADGALGQYDVLARLAVIGDPVFGSIDKPSYYFNDGLFLLWRFPWDEATEDPEKLGRFFGQSMFGLKIVDGKMIRRLVYNGDMTSREHAGKALFADAVYKSAFNANTRDCGLYASLRRIGCGIGLS